MEAKDYPFYAVQYHPEKNLYEWKVFADRSTSGVEFVQYISNKFVEKARQSKNSFSSVDEFTSISIYKYPATIPQKLSFTQIYLFKEVRQE
jgi:gamma-glutamyl hydrolase